MYCWHHRTKQVLSCKCCHTFWLLNHCFDAIFHWLHFLNILWILDFYSAFFCILDHLNVAFSLIFHYFDFFFFLIVTITFFTLFHLLLAHVFSLVFIDFILFKFSLRSSTSSMLFLWFSYGVCFFFISFWTFFDFFVVFYSLTPFLWISCCLVFTFFCWKFLAAFMLCDCYFLLQYNLILNYFWLTSSGGCPNHTFRHLIPQGTHNQGGQAHLAKMQLLTKSSIWHYSFQISSHLLVKKDIRSFQHYLSFLHDFYDCIITIPPPFFELHCCCVMTWHLASQMVCNSLQFILFASYHCLVHRKFHSLLNFLNWFFNFSKSL